jgi:UrcA family protein
LGCVGIGCGLSAARTASTEPRPRAISVAYADLDLSRRDDASIILGRLRLAAARACEVREVRRQGATLRRAIAACREEAVTQAVAGVDASELTRLYIPARR